MAIVFDKQLGNTCLIASATTVALTTANAVASSGFICLLVGWFSTGTLSSVSGGGLTWTIDKQIKNGSVGIAVVSAQAPAGLAASTVITATYSVTSPGRAISGWSYTGVASSAPVDASASATTGTGTWSCGGVTTTNADDVVVGCAMGDGVDTTSTPGGSFTEVPPTAGDFNTAGGGDSFTAVYQIVSATGTYTPTGTWAVAQAANAGVGVAYMAAAAAASVPPNLVMVPYQGAF